MQADCSSGNLQTILNHLGEGPGVAPSVFEGVVGVRFGSELFPRITASVEAERQARNISSSIAKRILAAIAVEVGVDEAPVERQIVGDENRLRCSVVVQSDSDEVLKLLHRNYRFEQVVSLHPKLRSEPQVTLEEIQCVGVMLVRREGQVAGHTLQYCTVSQDGHRRHLIHVVDCERRTGGLSVRHKVDF